ncbi:Na+/H+ antiporter NhaC [Pseudoalteromonas sp. T1lg75]|uniref:Na+/H+ antiporter NhaC n=1 Tax=Pseudoalteromonas sp. T1lg75 TaxID=2077102 RepID=UPI001F40F783|nr:Na+/H+ antiporter NhaC [Pseudoalteromonas sp. T1lg75]
MKNNKTPGLMDALVPLMSLLILLFMSVFFFGDESSSGPNQIVLLLCAGLACLIGLKNGYTRQEMEQGIVQGISLTLGAILILLAVGSLIGTWLLAGTVPTMIYFGLQLLEPSYFYVSASLICALVALCIGSSWTVAATIGVALMGVASGLGASGPVTAGAIISGAYFGDKLSPLSDTTNLAPAVAGADLFVHIRNMIWSTVPAYLLALLLFLWLGRMVGVGIADAQIHSLMSRLEEEFFIAWYLLLPLVFTLVMAMKKVPAFPAIGLGALMGGVWAVLFQSDLVTLLAHEELSGWAANLTVVWQVMYAGVALETRDPVINELLSGGGMGSMLNTIWLIICAMTFGSVMERTGLLACLVQRLIRVTRSAGSLISTTIVTAFGTNCIAADQYIGIVMPGRMFKEEYARRGLAPENLSRALEDGGTVTSALIPWNTCGAYMQSVLLINPLEYALFCFFNWLSPLIGIACALAGLRIKRLVTTKSVEQPPFANMSQREKEA